MSWRLPSSPRGDWACLLYTSQGYVPNFFEWARMLLPLGIALMVFLVAMWFIGKIDKPAPTANNRTAVASHVVASDEAIVADEIGDEPIDGGIVDEVAVKEAVATDKKEKSR